MRITVVGVGYVGLVSGACLAELGHTVTCVDTNAEKINGLNNGVMPILEHGLEDIVKTNVSCARLSFSTDLSSSVPGSDVVVIAVGTPPKENGTGADLSYIFSAAENIAACLDDDFTVVVTKSTVPVGTNHRIAEVLAKNAPENAAWEVASNPEFLREGSAVKDFMRPDRIVVGADSPRAHEVLAQVYAPLTENSVNYVATDVKSAELIKYSANAFLAVKIGFINEMADLCEQLGVKVENVARGIGLDRRIGASFLNPGPGYGGSCFPKDTQALLHTAEESQTSLSIVNAAVTANTTRKKTMAEKVTAACGGSVKGKNIAILGLTFKANTDDLRASPSLDIISALTQAGASVRAYDPEGMANARALFPQLNLAEDAYKAANNADCTVIATEWPVFQTLDFTHLKEVMAAPVVVDLRNLLNPELARNAGFTYHKIG